MTTYRYLSGVTTLNLDRNLCRGCGMCLAVCPHAVLTLENKKAFLADRDACMECGACARNCPEGALEVRPGVGCAWAIITGWIRRSEPCCGPPDNSPAGPTCCG